MPITAKVINYNWRQKVNNTKVGCKYSLKCQLPLVGKSRYCFNHWLDRTYVTKTTRFSVTVEELVALWDKQKGKCAITSCVLVPGKNVALDHIISTNKNGSHTVANLRFIHYSINQLKHSMSDIELKSIINEIGPALSDWAKGE
jgi:5-methylcytosine-specific restriction endonuclease McrA